MSYSNSQEQTIYRSLAGQIQLGFFDHGERFPSAKEIALGYGVSYCPAQRALKRLETNGLVRLCRGKPTVILAKPYANYLDSTVFRNRAAAVEDLCKSLHLISPAICMQGMYAIAPSASPKEAGQEPGPIHYGKFLYKTFHQYLHALGSRTVLSLYYDIGFFTESAFLDILNALYGKEEADLLLERTAVSLLQCAQNASQKTPRLLIQQLESLSTAFFERIGQYLRNTHMLRGEKEPFVWEPHKGRTRYCDIVAIDLICKINQGLYPIGTLLPNGSVLADIYHVSPITIRRTMQLLNQLGVAKTLNGVGTRVIFPGDSSIPYKLKTLTFDDNLRDFLEALQFLSVTGESVIKFSFPSFTEAYLLSIQQALSIPQEKKSMVSVISACMQAVVHCCPLASIQEIYRQITILLLKGSVLRLDETGAETVPGWQSLSQSMLRSLIDRDTAQFAHSWGTLMDDNFISTKKTLLEIGVSGIDGIIQPVHS
ncbi:transcriptional regulator [Lactonifactor longoviformis]|uniref:DNA-binding transcriptional regulator, FadR family n=1 Tax=Lactonifactor longoviformis DSM 17459 TaxID=1122155 RepID=A0A1M5BZV4_9CLOT|nr:GntR family transcriptional regulator [Lactonifactor longoviformis]POP31961.1 transcriptional regulator [Lactonifactor longoviformis]SHF48033.1 DNA-binding transcriptional regulator, FadR family [Lactonifactor longoviformis DSM 17459]